MVFEHILSKSGGWKIVAVLAPFLYSVLLRKSSSDPKFSVCDQSELSMGVPWYLDPHDSPSESWCDVYAQYATCFESLKNSFE